MGMGAVSISRETGDMSSRNGKDTPFDEQVFRREFLE